MTLDGKEEWYDGTKETEAKHKQQSQASTVSRRRVVHFFETKKSTFPAAGFLLCCVAWMMSWRWFSTLSHLPCHQDPFN